MPDRAHGMDDESGGEIEAGRDPRLARRAGADPGAGPGELQPRRPVDRPADSPAGREPFIGRVDDGIDGQVVMSPS